MSLPPDTIVHVTALRPLSEQTRTALVTLIEVAYAAAQRGLLPDESYCPQLPSEMDVPYFNAPPLVWGAPPNSFAEAMSAAKEKIPRKLKKRRKKEAARWPRPIASLRNAESGFNGRFA